MPILSIIVPVYNAEEYLDNCIQSIINQTFQDWELILVDDGSIDHSGEMCERYAAKDSRIIVKHQKNQGQSVARNIGLDIATGAYITFVDSDDEISSNSYKINIEILQDNCEIDFLQYPTSYEQGTNHPFVVEQKEGIISGKKEIFLSWYNANPINKSLWNKIFRREIISPFRFKEGRLHEDFLFLMELIQTVNTVYLSNIGLYFYYSRESSTLHSPSLQKDKDWVDAELTMLQQMYHYPEISSEYLGRYMSAARYLMNTTIKFPNADITCQLKHLKDSIPPIQCLWKGKQRLKNIFWYLNIRILGVFLFSQLYIFFLYKSNH